jgi:hypothetical protein
MGYGPRELLKKIEMSLAVMKMNTREELNFGELCEIDY